MRLGRQVDTSRSVDVRLTSLSTPLKLAAWEQHLCNHPDQDFVAYILKGIQQGFRIGVDSTHNFISATKNMRSATLNPQVIEEYIKQELELGNIVGPFSKTLAPAVHINRFGVIPKKHQPDKWRLITDLSFPEGASVNDSIESELCSLSYVTVEEVARQAIKMGRNSLLAKIDIKAAYRLVPVCPTDRTWLGMCWNEQVYVDAMLPFGLRSAPKIFNAVADALEWCIAKAGVGVLYHYLDDFVVLGAPGSEECAEHLQILQRVCYNLGVPLVPEKQEGPSTCITFLGIIIDTHRQELRLPKEKLERILVTLAEWERRKSCTRRELESLIGTLQHACTIIRSGRTFLRNAIPLLKMAKQQHHHIRWSVEIRSDLAWWKLFATSWNGTGLVIPPNPTTHIVTSDASGSWGCGAWFQDNWFSISWEQSHSTLHITVKEMVPILLAAITWGHNWKGGQVVVRCDNMAVVTALNNRTCREKFVMQMLRTLFFIEAHHQFKLTSEHVSGSNNTLADYLSRNQIELFQASHKTAKSLPAHINPSLLQWLLHLQLDWTSPAWTHQFSSFVQRQ